MNNSEFIDEVFCGDSLNTLKKMPSAMIDCIVTSPPYYGQRDYAVDGQLGGEDTPREYVTKLADLFDECRRVLKDTGTLWLNLGDKYLDGNLLGMPWRISLYTNQSSPNSLAI